MTIPSATGGGFAAPPDMSGALLELSVVSNGLCSRTVSGYYHTRNMAELLAGLARRCRTVRYFGGYLESGDPLHAFSAEAPIPLAASALTLVRGNSPSTGSLVFVRNNLIALPALARFIWRSRALLIFLPSFLSVVAGLLAFLLRKPMVVYLGGGRGGWADALRHERTNAARWIVYPLNRFVVERLSLFLAHRAVFVVTPAYDLHARLEAEGLRVALPVPMITVRPADLSTQDDTCHGAERRVLFVGALRRAKGIHVLLEAFGRLKARPGAANLKLWIAGDGEAGDALRAQATALGLAEDIVFFGHVPNGPDLFRVYRDCDVFAFPSFSEGFPRVLYEAMAFGLPIVTTKVGGVPYFLQDAHDACLVPAGDVGALARALDRVLADADLRRGLIAEARRKLVVQVFARAEREGSLAGQVCRGLAAAHGGRVAA